MVLGTLVKIIDRPSQAMQDVVDKPRSWWLPAVLLLASMVALLWISVPYTLELANERQDQTIARITSSMPEDQAELVRESAKPMTKQRMLLTGGITLAIMIPIGWLLRAALVHFSSMAMGGHSVWAGTFAVCVWAMMPFFVRDLLQIAWVLINKATMQHTGLGFLVASGDWMTDAKDFAYLALSQIDPFVIWHLILLTVAVAVATNLKKGQAAVLATIVWLIITALKVLPSYLSATLIG